jgi:transcriptional regulator with XRE-family HTH domain
MYLIQTKQQQVIETIVEVPVTLAEYVGYQIQQAREANGLKIKDLLRALDFELSITYVRNIEKGLDTFKLKDMEKICKVLNIEVASLFPPISKVTL